MNINNVVKKLMNVVIQMNSIYIYSQVNLLNKYLKLNYNILYYGYLDFFPK
jgi:hypothetical protein